MTGGDGLAPGARVGPYRLEEFLGEGAMAVVYRAVRDGDGQVVALKVLKSKLTADPTYQRRFVHEARAAQAVQHPHLVTILESGEADGRVYLAAAYVGGGSLAARLERERLDLAEILRIAAEVASGLDALHDAGLVHRDVKPANIMLDPQARAALTDFGLAKGPAFTALTRPGTVMGTLDYLAPELIRGQPGSPASDRYAFACVVYECVAGRPPFGDKGMFQVARAHLSEEPPDPTADRPDVPAQVAWAILQGLAKDPDLRPLTAGEYANMLAVSSRQFTT